MAVIAIMKHMSEKELRAGKGNVVPPRDKRFGQPNGNPRNPGGWKKTDTPRFKLEQMIKMSEKQIVTIANDKDAPLFERRLARSLLKENDFATTERMINQVYGKPKETVETIDKTPKAIEVKVIEPKDNASNNPS